MQFVFLATVSCPVSCCPSGWGSRMGWDWQKHKQFPLSIPGGPHSVPVSPSPSCPVPALAVYSSPAPDLPRRVGAQSTHRRGEPIEADQASRREIWRGADHQRRRAKCSSFSRRWSRDPDRASRTSPTPSASPTPPLGAHGRTTAEAPGYAPRTLLSSRYSPPGAGG
jgi:hypothetical protein